MPNINDMVICSKSVQNGNNAMAISDLELLIHKNKFEHIKMIATYSMNNFKFKLDRLIIIAIANGNLEITEYLLELGAVINYDIAIKTACFFGHIHMLKYLLNYNYSLNSELYLMAAYGSSKDAHIGYAKLIENNTIFRNDVFNFGESYMEIFQLLMENNIGVPELVFFEILNVKYYSMEIFGYMINLGICPTFILKNCIKYDILPIIKYLLENGANCNGLCGKTDDINEVLRDYGNTNFCLNGNL
jgi:ankyrin repeat protein